MLVQVVVGASPLMIVSDAVFHANNLARVAEGNVFLTSMTQHATPFRFPYGVSFYALLTPLYRAGLDPVGLVRWGAALAGVAAAGGLFAALVPRGPRLAAAAVGVLQLLPGTVDVLSFGNLSNAFAQAVTVLFFAWWVSGRAARGWWGPRWSRSPPRRTCRRSSSWPSSVPGWPGRAGPTSRATVRGASRS